MPFQSTPSAWRETGFFQHGKPLMKFQSTPSAWRETFCTWHCHSGFWHFNPLPPHGGRLVFTGMPRKKPLFQSTPSAWRETIENRNYDILPEISIHSLRMEGDYHALLSKLHGKISIHSLRMEGDTHSLSIQQLAKYFNPLPPHGGRQLVCVQITHVDHFNPLPPHGGRPVPTSQPLMYSLFQSTPSAWRETDTIVVEDNYTTISIHSLRMEGDIWTTRYYGYGDFISIHSLRMEGDVRQKLAVLADTAYFNPLPPHGGRPRWSGGIHQ